MPRTFQQTSGTGPQSVESIFLSRVEGRGFHVEGRGYHVEGNFFFFFKWKTNKKNLKNKWRVDISIHISSTCWVGRGRGGGGTEHVT